MRPIKITYVNGVTAEIEITDDEVRVMLGLDKTVEPMVVRHSYSPIKQEPPMQMLLDTDNYFGDTAQQRQRLKDLALSRQFGEVVGDNSVISYACKHCGETVVGYNPKLTTLTDQKIKESFEQHLKKCMPANLKADVDKAVKIRTRGKKKK